MPEPASLLLFAAAALALLLTPGPAVLYIVARSLEQGRRAGLVSTLGVGVGTLFHVGATALGVSALLASSALAFGAVKYLGAAYLLWLGARTLLGGPPAARAARPPHALRRVFAQGVLVNVFNPKTALFFLAFLPQFVSVERGEVAQQLFLLGLLFVCMGVLSDSVWALLAGSAGEWLKRRPAFARVQRVVSGTVYLALGLGAALSPVHTD